MEVMEEGDLMDRVPILLQRDRQYYDVNKLLFSTDKVALEFEGNLKKKHFYPTQQHQTVLQEIICPGVVGGSLDFPRSASFASVKLVEWY